MALVLSGSNGVQDNSGAIVSGTAQTASGTAVDFTGIPSWVKRVTVMFSEVSTSGTSGVLVQIGSGSVQTTGYVSTSVRMTTSAVAAGTSSTAGFPISLTVAAELLSGSMTIQTLSATSLVSNHTGKSATNVLLWGGGSVTSSGAIDRVRITTINGTDTFDAGTINILYE